MNTPVVLLTGASHGIGRATAFALSAKGYKLALIDRDLASLEDVATKLTRSNPSVIHEVCDVTNSANFPPLIARVESELGAIDVLVACAGVGGLTPVPELKISEFQAMLDVNVIGVANSIDSVLPGMMTRKRGHIVGISSVAGYRGLPWMASYSASKAALSAYLEGLRPALKRRGITITTVCPGFVRTAITEGTPFRKPVAMMEPEEAARHLVRAIERRPRNYVFPLSTAIGMTILRHLPDRIFDWTMDRAGPRALTTDF